MGILDHWAAEIYLYSSCDTLTSFSFRPRQKREYVYAKMQLNLLELSHLRCLSKSDSSVSPDLPRDMVSNMEVPKWVAEGSNGMHDVQVSSISSLVSGLFGF